MAKGVKPQLRTDKDSFKRSPPVPTWFSREAKAEWRRIMPLLIERKILTNADLGCVEAYCVAIGRIRELEALIQANPGDAKLYRLQTQSTQIARQLAAEIGATPVSRSRPVIREDAPDDEMSEFDI